MSDLTSTANPYAVFPGLKAANGCMAVICTRCWAEPGERCTTRFGNPAPKPHLVRVHRTDVVAHWEAFERKGATP